MVDLYRGYSEGLLADEEPTRFADMYGTAATGLLFAPSAGISDIMGLAPDPARQGEYLPSFGANIREGNYLDAGLQALGGAGDVMMAGGALFPPAAGAGALMKLPRAASVASRAVDVPDYPLMVQHNIHEIPLSASERLGGLPVPSLAISSPENPLMTFGDISLLGDPSMANPSAKNPVYSSDAYTARRPRAEVDVNKKAESFVKDSILSPLGEFVDYEDAEYAAKAIFEGSEDYASIPLRAKYMQDRGILPDLENIYGVNDFRDVVRSNFVESEDYYDWLAEQRNKMIDAGGEVSERLFLGYTPSGTPKYKPATLENMVKEMSKQGAGAEGFVGTMAATRAKVAEKFRTPADVRAARRRVVSPSRFEIDKEELQEIYDPFEAKIRNVVREKTGMESYEANRSAEELVEDLILGDFGKYEYHNQYKDIIDDDVFSEAEKIRNEMRTMNTEYFEAKPERAVSLSEFKGAIIPSNATKETVRILEDAGIEKIYKYSNQDERKSLYKKFPELMFSVGGLGLLGATATGGRSDQQGEGIL